MAPIPVEVSIPQNQECTLLLPAVVIQGVPEGQDGRDGSCRFLRGFTARRKRSWIPALAALLLASPGAWAQNGVFGPQPVGTPSGAQSVSVTAQLSGTVDTVEVLTIGAPSLDFAGAPGSPTCLKALTPGQTCTESVTFTPAAPGVRMGAVVLLDSGNHVLGTAYLSGTGSGGLGVLAPGNILPVAGDGAWKDSVVDGILATKSELYIPSGVTVDGAGNMYIADTFHNRIREVAAPVPPATVGVISTIAGNGTVGNGGDNGPAASATLDTPSGVALDGAGNLYIADTANNVVRMITAATGVITTVAGNGTAGYGGDGLSATSILTELNAPQSVTVDARGNLYIADTFNQRIRRVDAVSGIITTAAGNGTAGFGGDTHLATSSQTELNFPDAVAFDSLGNMYIADSLNNRVREVNASSGIIITFAGNGLAGDTGDLGQASAAELDAPSGVAADPAGNVYIADTQNNAIRKVSAASGIISTIAKAGAGESFYNGAFASVNIHGPLGLSLDGSANLYFADSLNMVIREVQSNFVALDFTKTPIRQGSTSGTQLQTVENDGNAPLDLTAPDIFVDTNDPLGFPNAALDAVQTTCPQSNPFLAAVDDDCVIGAVFAPSLSLVFAPGVSSMPLTPNIDIGKTGDTVNSPLEIELVAVATPLNSTTVALASTQNPSSFGQSVTFTATVTTGTGSLTGTVTFYDNNGATTLQAGVALNGGVANYTTSALTVGSHSITAHYNGDSSHFASDGSLVPVQVVNEATATSLISSANPSILGASVTFTATVTAPAGGGVSVGSLAGYNPTVTFTSGGTTLCASPLVLAGTTYAATCSTTALPQGSNTVTATYSGDAAANVAGSSTTLAQDVPGSSTITLSSNSSPSYYGNPVQFTVTVPTIGSFAATGTVNLYMTGQAAPLNGSTPLTLSTVAGTGTVKFTTSSLPVSTIAAPDNIYASYSGDLNYSGGNSNTVPQVVNQAVTQTTVSAAPNPAIATKAITLTAAVTITPGDGVSTPTGNVNFTDSFNGGAALPITCTPQPIVAAPTCVTSTLAAGTHSIVATYVGDTNDAGSQSSASALTVTQETVTLASSDSSSIYGMPVTFTVTVPTIGAAAATGTVNILLAGVASPIGTVTLSGNPGSGTFQTTSLPASTVAAPDVITASYLGNGSYLADVSLAVDQVVNTATTATTVAALPNPGIAGAPVAITATVKVTQGVATPTGTVTFVDTFNGAPVPLGSPALTGGLATVNPILAPGLHSIVATYSGDTNDNTSNGTLALTVVLATTTTALTSSGSPSLVLAPVTFTAKVTGNGATPGGSVTFTDTFGGATVNLGPPAPLTAGTATLTTSALAAGTHSITANYGGDANDATSSSTIPQVVGAIPTVTDLAVTTTTGINPQVFLVAVVLNSPSAGGSNSLPIPTGTVIFSTVNGSTSTQIGSSPLDSSGVATLIPSLPTGTYNLVAAYSGDTDHSPSTSNAAQISTTATGFNLTVTPASVTIPATQYATVNVALTSTNGFTDTVGLGCASLPAGVNCHFSLATVTLQSNSVQNVTLTIDTNNPLGGGAAAMNAQPGSRSVALAGLFLPLSIFFGCVYWRFRRRYAGSMTTALVLLLGVAALLVSGCSGSFTQSSAAPGSYVIQVTGTGANSDIIHYQNVTLIITAK